MAVTAAGISGWNDLRRCWPRASLTPMRAAFCRMRTLLGNYVASGSSAPPANLDGAGSRRSAVFRLASDTLVGGYHPRNHVELPRMFLPLWHPTRGSRGRDVENTTTVLPRSIPVGSQDRIATSAPQRCNAGGITVASQAQVHTRREPISRVWCGRGFGGRDEGGGGRGCVAGRRRYHFRVRPV
jgi:hypothetical protein